MKPSFRCLLVILSVVALAAPAAAQRPSKAERMKASRHAAVKVNPVAPPVRAPVKSGTDWDFLVGVDRASSPYGHDGY